MVEAHGAVFSPGAHVGAGKCRCFHGPASTVGLNNHHTRENTDMQTVLNPFGRLGPVAFRNAALVLIAIGACFSLIPLINPGLAALSFCGVLLLYPSIVIWVKRFHDAGKSGWWFLAVFAGQLVAGVVANRFIVARFVPPPPPVDPNFIWQSMVAQMQANAIPNTISSVIISLAFILVINEELKSDPQENKYGPATAP
jgi:uncharacterized membrane protein YhaH (DUF805 family)